MAIASVAPAIVGIVLIIVAIVFIVKLMREVLVALLMVGVLVLGIFMFLNSVPSLAEKTGFESLKEKMSGTKISDSNLMPSGVDKILLALKVKGESVDVVGTGVDEQGNLLVVVVNTGKDELKDFAILVEGKPMTWKNKPLIPLSSGKSTIFQTNYRPVGEVNVEVKAGNVSASYP